MSPATSRPHAGAMTDPIHVELARLRQRDLLAHAAAARQARAARADLPPRWYRRRRRQGNDTTTHRGTV